MLDVPAERLARLKSIAERVFFLFRGLASNAKAKNSNPHNKKIYLIFIRSRLAFSNFDSHCETASGFIDIA